MPSKSRLRAVPIATLVLAAALAAAPGVSRSADGVVLKTFTTGNGLRNNWIKGVFRDGDRLLVAHVAGTDLYEPFDRKFVPFEPPAGFKGGRITGIAAFGGKTYVGTDAALNVREGGKWTSLERHLQVVHSEEVLTASPTALYTALLCPLLVSAWGWLRAHGPRFHERLFRLG